MTETPTPRTVVVAEDEVLIRMDLAEMLTEEGYDVVGQAGDGATAVELAEQHRPDLVILDVKMPVLDGIAAAERIAGARIAPVVILTAFSQRDLVERARDAGAMAYLVKPFTRNDLVPAIEMAVSRFAELSQLESEVADLSERLETRKAVERAKSILQEQLRLSEPEAFRWIQKTAMDLRLSMRQVADGVVEHGVTGRRLRGRSAVRRVIRRSGSHEKFSCGCRSITDRTVLALCRGRCFSLRVPRCTLPPRSRTGPHGDGRATVSEFLHEEPDERERS